MEESIKFHSTENASHDSLYIIASSKEAPQERRDFCLLEYPIRKLYLGHELGETSVQI